MYVMNKKPLCFYPCFYSTLNFLKNTVSEAYLTCAESFPTGGIDASFFSNNSVCNFQCGQWTLVMATYEEFAKHPLQ